MMSRMSLAMHQERPQYVRAAADYYLSTRLRSSPEEQQRYCKPLKAS